MPNWVYQDLHIVGPKETIDRFIDNGFVKKQPGDLDDVLEFRRLCPLARGARTDTYTHESAVVLRHFRSDTQALFSMKSATSSEISC